MTPTWDPRGVQRITFSLLKPLSGAPWRPKGSQSGSGEAQGPSKDQKWRPKATQSALGEAQGPSKDQKGTKIEVRDTLQGPKIDTKAHRTKSKNHTKLYYKFIEIGAQTEDI